MSVAKDRIMLAAIRLFREKGYQRTTVRDIASVVGIQSGSLFHHFESKESILKQAFSEAISALIIKMREAQKEERSVEAVLLKLIEYELEAVSGEGRDAVGLLINEWNSLSEESQQEMLQLRQDYEAIWKEVLRQAYQEKRCKLKSGMTRKFLLGAIGWTTTWYKQDGQLALQEIAKQLLQLVLIDGGPTNVGSYERYEFGLSI